MTYLARLNRNEREVQRLYTLASRLVLIPKQQWSFDPGPTLHLGFGRARYTKLDQILDTIGDEYGYQDWFDFVRSANQGDDIDASRKSRLREFHDVTRNGRKYGSLRSCAQVTGVAADGTYLLSNSAHAVRDLHLPLTERWLGDSGNEQIHHTVCDTCGVWVTSIYNLKTKQAQFILPNPLSDEP